MVTPVPAVYPIPSPSIANISYLKLKGNLKVNMKRNICVKWIVIINLKANLMLNLLGASQEIKQRDQYESKVEDSSVKSDIRHQV